MKNLNCIGCGATSVMVEFEQRSMQVAYKGLAQVLDGLAGWSCRQCGEIEFSASSAMRYASAGDQLVKAARREKSL